MNGTEEVEERSALWLLLDMRLRGLDDYVEVYRDQGRSWQWISSLIRANTGVYVTGETLRRWYEVAE